MLMIMMVMAAAAAAIRRSRRRRRSLVPRHLRTTFLPTAHRRIQGTRINPFETTSCSKSSWERTMSLTRKVGLARTDFSESFSSTHFQ